MQKRRLGKTDLELTTVGLGTWAMGGPWEFGWGPQDDDEAVGAILAALDAGINWIDTAPAYGLGHSEELVAQALKQTDHNPIIASKCGILWNDKKIKSRNGLSCRIPLIVVIYLDSDTLGWSILLNTGHPFYLREHPPMNRN